MGRVIVPRAPLISPSSKIAGVGGPPSVYTTSFPTSLVNLGTPFVIGDNNGENSSTGPQVTGGTPGRCYSRAPNGVDYLGVIPNLFDPVSHFAEVVINWDLGYVAPDTQEIELLGFFTLASGVTVGYELDIWFGGTILQGVRWDGIGNYDFGAVVAISGAWPGILANGDRVRADFTLVGGNVVIPVKINGFTVITLGDSTAGRHTSGGPGMGYFSRNGTGYAATGYCAKEFTAGTI